MMKLVFLFIIASQISYYACEARAKDWQLQEDEGISGSGQGSENDSELEPEDENAQEAEDETDQESKDEISQETEDEIAQESEDEIFPEPEDQTEMEPESEDGSVQEAEVEPEQEPEDGSAQVAEDETDQNSEDEISQEAKDETDHVSKDEIAQEQEDGIDQSPEDETFQEPEDETDQDPEDKITQKPEDDIDQGSEDGNIQEEEDESAQESEGGNAQEPESCEEPTVEDEPRKWVTIDAAIGYKKGENQVLELFVGDKVQILSNKVGIEIHDRKDFALPRNLYLQAAYVAPKDLKRKHFYGGKYGYFRLYSDPMKMRKFKYGRARKFLRNGGPDAAGKLGETVYFFKGCWMAIRLQRNKWKKSKNVKSVGLPCRVDAAWSESQGMVVLKGDQFWIWNEGSGLVSGPTPFHEKYQLLDDWTLKPAPDQQSEHPAVLRI